jgi:hypothetical protein
MEWEVHGMRGLHGGAGLAMAGVLLGVARASAQEAGQGALACYELAEREVSLSSEQALWLCRGAISSAPAECYAASRAPATLLSTEDAIDLCRCTRSPIGPVACYQRAEDETFLETREILLLCSPSLAYALLPDCQPNVLPAYPWWVPRYGGSTKFLDMVAGDE